MDASTKTTSNATAAMAHPFLPTNDNTALVNTQSEQRLGQSYDSEATATSTSDNKFAYSTSTSPASLSGLVAAETDTKSSLEKLPGELRNRIYRAYFDLSTKERKETPNLRLTAPSFLPLLHTNRTIRSEAGSILDKEHLYNGVLHIESEFENISLF